MTSSAPPVPEQVSKTSDQSAWADFTQLTGIGPATQKQLHESLGIHTFTDLARLDPNQLISHFRQVERTISITQAESWIEQANHRLDAFPHALLDNSVEDCQEHISAAVTLDDAEALASAPVRRQSFWPMPPVITQVSFHQPWRYPSDPALGIATPTQPMRQPLKRLEPFALTIHFHCSTSNGPALTSTSNALASDTLNDIDLLHYSVEVYAHHRQSGSVKCLGHLPHEPIRFPRAASSLNQI